MSPGQIGHVVVKSVEIVELVKDGASNRVVLAVVEGEFTNEEEDGDDNGGEEGEDENERHGS